MIVHHLDFRIPPSVRVDLFQIIKLSDSGKCVQYSLSIGSAFGIGAEFPLIKSIEVTFLNRPDLQKAISNKKSLELKREICNRVSFTFVVKLNFCDGCGIQSTTVEFPVNFQKQVENISYI